MNTQNARRPEQPLPPRPWYREPWPWVAIAIPATAVVASMFTLYLAITNPDYLVVEDEQYDEIRSELRALPDTEPEGSDYPAESGEGDAGH